MRTLTYIGTVHITQHFKVVKVCLASMHFYKNDKLDGLLTASTKQPIRTSNLQIAHGIQKIIAENQVTIPVLSGAWMYQYNTTLSLVGGRRQPERSSSVWAGIPERLLHVLDLKPVK